MPLETRISGTLKYATAPEPEFERICHQRWNRSQYCQHGSPPRPTQADCRDQRDKEIHQKRRAMQTSEQPDTQLGEVEYMFEQHADEQPGPGKRFKPGGCGEYLSDLQVE